MKRTYTEQEQRIMRMVGNKRWSVICQRVMNFENNNPDINFSVHESSDYNYIGRKDILTGIERKGENVGARMRGQGMIYYVYIVY